MTTDTEEAFEESLYFHLSRQTPKSRWIYTFISSSLIGAILLLPFLHVQVGVSVSGMIRAADPVHTLRSPVSGTLERIFMDENLTVSRGDTLARLQTNLLENQLSQSDNEIARKSRRLHDLETLLNNPFPDQHLLESLQDPLVRQSFLKWLDRYHHQTTRVSRTARDLRRIEQLAEQKFSSPKELENAVYEMQQARQKLEQIHSGQVLQWQELHEETRLQRIRLQEQRGQDLDKLDRHIIRAPRSGTLQEVVSLQPGSELQALQELARITPDSELIAELYIPSADIGWVREKMPVRIRLDAFDYREWGLLYGTIHSIPRDITMDPSPHYRVRASLDTTHLELENGFRGHLRKGMTLKARLLLTRRSLLQLLFDRAEQWLDPRWSNLDSQPTSSS